MSSVNEPSHAQRRELQPQDLRGILKYVPMWRDHTFVVAVDGALVHSEACGPLMTEVAVLHSLGIQVVLAFGIGQPLRTRAESRALVLSDFTGEDPVDQQTLDLSIEVAGAAQYLLVQGLVQNGIQCAVSHAVRATEKGVLKGSDHLHGGKVDRVDVRLLKRLMEQGIIPILPPVAFGRDGRPLRLNSDHLAAAVAQALSASKLIYLVPHPGLTLRGEFQLNMAVDELEARLNDDPEGLDAPVRSKALAAIETIRADVPRAHIIDGRIPDALLTEIFSTVGVGSMIHANPYTRIRSAQAVDVDQIHRLTKAKMRDESLRVRTRAEIEAHIHEYVVYEIDESVIACCRLSGLSDADGWELMSLVVQPAYGQRGVGRALVAYALDRARAAKVGSLYALSTQTAAFFTTVCAFQEIPKADAPPSLVKKAYSGGRNSRILCHALHEEMA